MNSKKGVRYGSKQEDRMRLREDAGADGGRRPVSVVQELQKRGSL